MTKAPPKISPKRGRPTKFTKDKRIKAEKLSRRGFTDKEIAEILDINESTFHRWKLKQEPFCKSLNMWKETADSKVEHSLYERACGYSHAETKAQWVDNKDGARWEYAELIKHYPPDPTSMIFWLKNRQKEKWRDSQDLNVDASKGLLQQIAQVYRSQKADE